MTRKIRGVAVVGAGTMGSGIAQVALESGFSVFLYDADEKALLRAHAKISRGLEKRGQSTYLARLHFKRELAELNSADCAIEAAPENLPLKQRIFRDLDRCFARDCLLATNTSSLSVTAIASAARHAERVLGLHFFNPPPVMKLVEVVCARQTSQQALEAATALAQAMGKTPVRVKDLPGFIANRVSQPFYLVALRLLEAGEANLSAIDAAVRSGDFKMGPFELMDFIGLDVHLAIAKTVFEGLRRPDNLRTLGLEEELVRRGFLGRKSGAGFYLYKDQEQPWPENPVVREILSESGREGSQTPGQGLAAQEILRRVVQGVIDECNRAYAEDVASREEMDLAMKLGMAWPKGPFEWDRELKKT